MNIINRQKERELEAYVREIQEDDEHEFSIYDDLLLIFYPIKKGIRKNGKTVEEIGIQLKRNMNNHKQLCRTRVDICWFRDCIVKYGIAFDGLKCGKYMRYNFADGRELEEIEFKQLKNLQKGINSSRKYFDESSKINQICGRMSKEIDQQLMLFNPEQIKIDFIDNKKADNTIQTSF